MAYFNDAEINEILEAVFNATGHVQYIGARYVPIFGRKNENNINWDNTAPYEPLTIVLYQGNSYTSRQYVPTGVDISNNLYWAETGNYNAQVEQYRNEVLSFNDRITANANNISSLSNTVETLTNNVSNDIETLTNDISSIETNIGTITGNVSTLTSDVANINNIIGENVFDNINTISASVGSGFSADESIADIIGMSTEKFNPTNTIARAITNIENSISDAYANHNAVIIGDSYAFGTGASDHSTTNNSRWSSLLCSYLDMREFNFAVGGTGFYKPNTATNNFDAQIARALQTMTNNEITDTKLVIIQGGYNDAKASVNPANLYTAAANCVAAAANGFPNARVVVVPFLWPAAEFTLTDRYRYFRTVDGCFKGNKLVRVLEMPFTWLWGNNDMITSDNIHPNDDGHRLIADMILSGLAGCSTIVNKLFIPTQADGFSFLSENTGGIYCFYEEGKILFTSGRVTNSAAMQAGTAYNIGSVPKGAIPKAPIYMPIYASNKVVGSLCIYTNGSLLVNLEQGVTVNANAGFPTPSCTYIPYGSF